MFFSPEYFAKEGRKQFEETVQLNKKYTITDNNQHS